MVENLLERGCPLDVRDCAGNLPWHFAVHGKAVELVTSLLDRGCPLDAVNDNGQNALHFAAETGAVLCMPCFQHGACRGSTLRLLPCPMRCPRQGHGQCLTAHQSQTTKALCDTLIVKFLNRPE